MNRKSYPFILIRKAVFFPTEKVPLVLEGQDVINTVNGAIKEDGFIVAAFQKNGDMSSIGVLGKILQFWSLAPSIMGIILEGKARVRISRVFKEGEIEKAETEELVLRNRESAKLQAFSRNIFDQFRDLVRLSGNLPLFLVEEIQKSNVSPESLGYIVASVLNLDFKEKLKLLELIDLEKWLEIVNRHLAEELNIIKAERKIQDEVEKEVGKTQKDFILRERMKAIEKELGLNEENQEYDLLEKKIKRAMMPKEAEEVAFKELHRLRSMPATSAEAPYIRTYLDWLTELPWSIRDRSVLDLPRAKEILDEDHYGLEKVKERIIESLAVQKLTKGRSGPTIMCFVGPPGTGKTSVGKSIARALNRKFFRLSLGGIRDEAEIRGHRRTYVGAMPGRIIQGIKTAGAKNPVFMLDEIDKMGADFKGDPSSALLEVLDPEQNRSFSDHYLEIPFDLSEVFFISTANVSDTVPETLRDRMEIIEFFGYTDEEKFQIAKNFLIPKVLTNNGLDPELLRIEEGALKKIINKYTREAGVRNLERRLAEISRKVARGIAEKQGREKTVVTEANLADFLGPEEFEVTMREAKDEVGISTGIAWTPSGGEIIFVEATIVPGRGRLILTGQLGETMKESAKAALSFIRSKSQELKFDPAFYKDSDIHIHVPSGAIPKDGPSAGIAIAASLASILTDREVKKEVALTGEITLSGKVLKVGGIKEKVLAAHRAGVETIILPKDNENNLQDVPPEVKERLSFRFVSHMDEVLEIALKL